MVPKLREAADILAQPDTGADRNTNSCSEHPNADHGHSEVLGRRFEAKLRLD
jgi:hypothetical protein